MRSKTDGALIGDSASGIWRGHRYDTVYCKEEKQKEQQRFLFFYGEFIP